MIFVFIDGLKTCLQIKLNYCCINICLIIIITIIGIIMIVIVIID